MKPVHRLRPRADGDTAAPATGPLPLIDAPEGETLLCINPPFSETGVVVNGVGDVVAGLSFWNRARRAVLGAALSGHAEIMEAKGNRFVRLHGQVRGHGLEPHVVAIFRRQDSPCPAEFPDPRIQGDGDHV